MALREKYAHLDTDEKRSKIFGTSKDFEGEIIKKESKPVNGETVETITKGVTSTGDSLKFKIESYDKSVCIQEWIL